MKRISHIIQRLKRGSNQNSLNGSINEEMLNNMSTNASIATTTGLVSNPDSITAVNSRDMIHLRLYSIHGKLVEVNVSQNLSGLELKKEAISKLLYPDAATANIPNNILDLTHLIYSKTKLKLDENTSLQDLGVNNMDEFVLIQKSLKIEKSENLQGPKLNDVMEITKNLQPTKSTPPIVNLETFLLQNDLQFDIRKILISLAQSSAYVIGAGPYAERLIAMLKLRLLNRRKHEADTIQCLVDMGFAKERVIYALRIKGNVYAAALEWLIENQSTASLDVATTPETTISNKINLKNTPCENIEALLEIIRIYSHRSSPPARDMIKSLVDMGFIEENVTEALKVTRNNQAAACEWLIGNRSRSLTELRDGLPPDSPVLKALLTSPQIQISLGNPKMFLAYLAMLENYSSMAMWLGDSDTSGVLGHILRTYHEEKQIIARNQFCSTPVGTPTVHKRR